MPVSFYNKIEVGSQKILDNKELYDVTSFF